ncbi:MAG: mechanosensitive ion channel [Clostridia bacterium]
MESFVDNLAKIISEESVKILLTVTAAIVVLLVGFKLIHWLMKITSRSKLSARMDPTVHTFVNSMMSIGLKSLLVVAVCGIVGIPTASIIAVLGSAGVAIGLAMQGSLSNFAGGVMILMFKPFVSGDYIEVPNIQPGTVTEISIFYTTLLTVDNRKIVIPNGTVSNSALINYSAKPIRRVDLSFGVSFSADIDQVRNIILKEAAQCPLLLADPAPIAVLESMADSAMMFGFRGWCSTIDYLSACYDMRERVKKALDANSISIPFPQLDVHMKSQ